MKTYSTIWSCPECEQETEVTFYPEVPAKLNSPPEDCYPGEPALIEPDECRCGKEITTDEISDLIRG